MLGLNLNYVRGHSKLITGSDIGLSPNRRQAIIWTNAGLLLALDPREQISVNVVWKVAVILPQAQCVKRVCRCSATNCHLPQYRF